MLWNWLENLIVVNAARVGTRSLVFFVSNLMVFAVIDRLVLNMLIVVGRIVLVSFVNLGSMFVVSLLSVLRMFVTGGLRFFMVLPRTGPSFAVVLNVVLFMLDSIDARPLDSLLVRFDVETSNRLRRFV